MKIKKLKIEGRTVLIKDNKTSCSCGAKGVGGLMGLSCGHVYIAISKLNSKEKNS